MNFWQDILAKKGMILALAPMDGVSDYPFRAINKKYGGPDVVFSEFANVEGICRSSSSRILDHFDFDEKQRYFVAQLFGKTPKFFKQAAVLLAELGADGIDINMGCPAPTVANHGSGAAIIKNPELAREIIRSVQEGVQEWRNGLKLEDCPDISAKMLQAVKDKKQQFVLAETDRSKYPLISVKTRMGYHEEEIITWLPNLIDMNLAAISLHGRTLKQGYSGKADWQVIAKAAKMVHQSDPNIVFLGNGDIASYEEAKQKVADYQVDGVLIGRASFGKPFVFLPEEEREKFLEDGRIFAVALEHAKLYERTYPADQGYNFLPMRKHLAWYIKGVNEAATIRAELVRSNNSLQVQQILEKYNLI